MNFEELQKTWQAQQAPEAAPAGSAPPGAARVLDQVKALQRKVIFSNLGMTVSLSLTMVFLGWMWANQENATAWFHVGMALIFADMLLTMPLVWLRSVPWGNLRPDLSSREYIRAALKSFRFRQTSQRIIMPVYGLTLFVGIHLVYLGLFYDRTLQGRLWVHGGATAFMIVLFIFTFYRQRHRYQRKFEPVVKELEQLERELSR